MALRAEFTYSGDRSTLTKRLYSAKTFTRVQNLTFFKKHGLVGPMADNPDPGVLDDEDYSAYAVVVNNEVTGKTKGDRVTLPMFVPFTTGNGKFGENTLVDSELNLTYRNLTVPVNLVRQGAAWLSEMSEQRFAGNLQRNVEDGLRLWMAQTMDDDCFEAIYNGYGKSLTSSDTGGLAISSAEHPNKIFGGSAPDEASVDESGVLNTDALERANVWCQTNNIPYLKVKGYDDVRVIVIHPYQWKTLRNDAVWRADNREGWNRGMDNPLFKTALGMCAGFLVHMSNKIQTPSQSQGGGNATQKRRAIILGPNAVLRVVVKNSMEIRTRKEDDYGNKIGKAIQAIYGDVRADFDTDPSGTKINQSSALLTTWAPNPI